jgi:hypothetical protein
MKSSLLCLAAVTILVLGFSSREALAQSAPNSGSTGASAGAGQRSGPLSSLSPEDKAKLMKARQEVLAQNPDLQTEQDNLKKERQDLKNNSDASPEDKMQLLQDFQAHEKKMQAAMIKLDPSLKPILDKLDAQMKEKFQQRAAQAGGN